MTSRTFLAVAAITSLLFGIAGLVQPQALVTALGIELDTVTTIAVRLACAAYVGYGVLSWMMRSVTETAAWRAVAAANGVSWGLSAVTFGLAVAAGLGDGRAWLPVVLQAGFAVAWALVLVRAPRTLARTARSAA